MIILTTERLILREFRVTDAEAMFHLNSDEEVMKYTGDVSFDSVEETKLFLQNYSDYEQHGFGRWVVITKDERTIIGWCGLKKHADNTVDLGYRLVKREWNKGYATEASEACINYGFNVLELEEIVANSDKGNVASIRVMEKIGMNFHSEQNYDGIENAVLYKLTKEEYLNN